MLSIDVLPPKLESHCENVGINNLLGTGYVLIADVTKCLCDADDALVVLLLTRSFIDFGTMSCMIKDFLSWRALGCRHGWFTLRWDLDQLPLGLM